jgi:hypothetical protein
MQQLWQRRNNKTANQSNLVSKTSQHSHCSAT